MRSDLDTSHEPITDRPSAMARLLGRLPRPQLRVGGVVVLVLGALILAVLVSLFGSGGAVQTVGGAELSGRSDADPSAPPSSSSPDADTGELYVHVLGAVATPGLYRVSDGARAFDAIAAAGGLLPEADPAGVNLARFVSDGEQLVVPVVGEVSGGVAPPGAGEGQQLVNLNTATAAELVTLPRIGEALAARIIAWRDANGRFTSVDDLAAVEGIGTKTLDGLRASATV